MEQANNTSLQMNNIRERGVCVLSWEYTVHHGGEGTVTEMAGIMTAEICEGACCISANQGEERLGLEVGPAQLPVPAPTSTSEEPPSKASTTS